MTHSTDTLPERRPARRGRDLGTKQWLLLCETFATLAGASAAIAALPFRRVVALASRDVLGSRSSRFDTEDLVWAVEAIARRVPWRTVCFQKGLALHLMLRRHGIPSVLHYGVGKGNDGELAAHVWIGVGDQTVLGGEVIDRFRRLASYPGPAEGAYRPAVAPERLDLRDTTPL